MKHKLLFIFVVILNMNVLSQFNCNDIFYNEDSLVIINNELYSGACKFVDKNGKVETKCYYNYGVLDSIEYYNKKGLITVVEPYIKEMINGIVKVYYKSGALRREITCKNDKNIGLYREYYQNGKIKYEADFIDETTTKDDSYFTWTKKGIKYLHKCVTITKNKEFGKMFSHFSYSKCKKIKVDISN
jgi:antitoxin component YwqK of YwqJK toxin-antitoxin module